ncbi:hypothetical protein [Marinomonas balearica]|uniref:Uncharacterized protein n=1 Tax=Marinomonas balearica TaxID=491947 RepID=A0A4R6M7K6_9GAMM|nr:hypothetical protein [Marinomonas balearica]TDO97397.1 hypothetical protein DFP79_2215 [Marinomonas balearica]
MKKVRCYFSTDEDCRAIAPDLVPAKRPWRFAKHKAPKTPHGPVPIGNISMACDGRVLSYELGTRGYSGFDTAFLYMAAVIGGGGAFLDFLAGELYLLNPWSDHPDALESSMVYWGITLPLLFLGLFCRYKAKSEGIENLVFHRDYGTVTFAESPGFKKLTVPFEAVELGVYHVNYASLGVHSWSAILCSTLKPKGKRFARDVMLPISGYSQQDFQEQWNMICCFMDKSRPYPKCLRAIIDGYNNHLCKDIWETPIPPECRITRKQLGLPENYDSPFSHYEV